MRREIGLRIAVSPILSSFFRPAIFWCSTTPVWLPARLFGRKDTGGAVEILIERIIGAHEARVQLGVSKKPNAGGRIVLDDGTVAIVTGRDGEFFLLRFEIAEPLEKLLCRGWVVCRCRRTSVAMPALRMRSAIRRFTREKVGAVAAPTAGLHFDKPLLDALGARGVDFRGYVTLHVGLGTFRPGAQRAHSGTNHRDAWRVGRGRPAAPRS